MAEEARIALPAGLDGLRIEPCAAPPPTPYGTRTGTWAEAESFLHDWAHDGRSWVNLALRVSPTGVPYLCYEVPDRGDPDKPLAPGDAPDIVLHGPVYDRRGGGSERG
jgi:hypothetical protein